MDGGLKSLVYDAGKWTEAMAIEAGEKKQFCHVEAPLNTNPFYQFWAFTRVVNPTGTQFTCFTGTKVQILTQVEGASKQGLIVLCLSLDLEGLIMQLRFIRRM